MSIVDQMIEPVVAYANQLIFLLLKFLMSDLFLKVMILPGAAFVSVFAIVAVWGERKLLARVMLRIGPLHVGRYAGCLQVIADFLKLILKEVIVPKNVHRALFVSMPVLFSAIAMFPLVMIPFSEDWIVFSHSLSLLFVLAVLSLAPLTVLLAGWASSNKYSFIGGLREGFQMIAYEVPLILSAVGVAVMARSLDIVEIVKAQSSYWFIVLQPLGFIVFFLAGLAQITRTPFDIPEAEQEIVIGWMTEYSGIFYGICFMAMYEMFLVYSLLVAELYLGGWHGPFLPPMAWLLIKMGLVCLLAILIRGGYPRLRMDQLIRMGWKILTPLAIANLVMTMVAVAVV